MVSQTNSDEWQSPPPRPGTKLPADCRPLPPQGTRNPPSYLDAVRSRHSLSQPDSSKLLRTINSQMQYNSLPRPQPQRLQGGPANGFDSSRRPKAEEEVDLMSRGFQVYSRPPGPANHVPLMGTLRASSSNSLPRHLPSSRSRALRDHGARDFQQPLSVIVQRNDFQERPLKQIDKSNSLPCSEWSHLNNGIAARVPHFNGTANGETASHKERKPTFPPDARKYLPNERLSNGSMTLAQFYQQSRYPAYRGNNPQYPRWGTLPSRRPNRIAVPEPAVSLRTGPLGSYPDFGSNPAESPPILPPKSVLPSMQFSKSINTQANCNNGLLLEIDRQQEYADARSHPSTNGCGAAATGDRNPLYPLHESEHAFRRVVSEKSATLPTRKSRTSAEMESFGHAPVNFRQSPPNILRNGAHQPEHANKSIQHEDPTARNNSRDYYEASPQEKNPCHTPEDVGLVMIVEARDLNIKSKDLVKPTARMAMSQDGFNSAGNCSFASNSNYGTPQHFLNSDPMPPALGINCTSGSYSMKEQSISYLSTSSNETGQGVNQSRNMGSVSARQYGDPILRRTPLSSSTASLSSELSSVSSRHKHSESALERLRNSNRNGQAGRSIAAQKKSVISPSPWLREEKEQLQKQHIQGMRKARDEEIAYLQTLPERTADQEERLRVWLLEREFQRRAEEVADEDEEEEEESLLERAELRERMLMMERTRDSTLDYSQSPKANSSSDQWLRTSQAKHQPKLNESDSGSSNLNGSFEVQQLNDLLETMNMSPVIRETTSDDEGEAKTAWHNGESDTPGVNKACLGKATLPTLAKSSSNRKTSPCLDFCHSLSDGTTFSPPGDKDTSPPAFNAVAPTKKLSSTTLLEDFVFNAQPKVDGRTSPKMPTRGTAIIPTIDDVKANFKANFPSKSKDYASPRTAREAPSIQDSPICKTIRELRSPDRNLASHFDKKFSSRSGERKKATIAKPETLPFQDKIRIFSLKAGEEGLPRDKVKNSRAQRELEVKFSSDANKSASTDK